MQQQFTGFQYLLIDVANAYGEDKANFGPRIDWAVARLDTLEEHMVNAENKALYTKAVQAIRKAQAGIPTGHLVGLDAVCSGMQIMSAITGCEAGARATGLIDTGKRPDAYTEVTEVMNVTLGNGFTVPRADAKRATMTSLYGSKKVPKDLFGEETPELAAFYKAMTTVAPGAWSLLQTLLGSWQPYALNHAWQLPDGFNAVVKVMQKFECRIEVDELEGATFTHEYHDNVGTEKGISLAANVVHSIDAYVLRSVHRRCNYDREMVKAAYNTLCDEQVERNIIHTPEPITLGSKTSYYIHLWEETGVVDAVILPHLTSETVQELPDALLKSLTELTLQMLNYAPFPVVAIHDEFKCGPNHMNHLRKVYSDILAELAEGKVLDFILSKIHGKDCTYSKNSTGLGKKIRESNYSLC
jgi:hypothetical protein